MPPDGLDQLCIDNYGISRTELNKEVLDKLNVDRILHNFHPYSPRAKIKQTYESPAHKFNGFVYHDNWLHNLLISASMGGYRQ